jgi:hypothetical protein
MGNEFTYLNAESDGPVDVHVFQGRVQASQTRADGTVERYPLASQMAMRIQPNYKQNLYFIANRRSFPAFESPGYSTGYFRWYAYKNELKNDIDLLAYYDFQNVIASESSIFNSSAHPLARNFNATRYGAAVKDTPESVSSPTREGVRGKKCPRAPQLFLFFVQSFVNVH